MRACGSNAGVPLIALIFPVTALALTDFLQGRNKLERADIFGVLVAKLIFNAQTKRRAVVDRHGPVVQLVGENRLRMNGVDEIDAFIIIVAVAVGIHTAKNHILGLGQRLDSIHDLFQAYAFPLTDDAPTFDAIVTRDLGARWHGFQFSERETRRLFNQAGDLEPPFGPLILRIGSIVHRNRRRIAVGAKRWRDLLIGKFLSELGATREQTLHAAIAAFGGFENRLHSVVAAETVKDPLASAQNQQARAMESTKEQITPRQFRISVRHLSLPPFLSKRR